MAKKYAEQIQTSQCTPNTAIYTYNSCFIKATKYSIPVTSLAKKWNTILALALETILNKSAMAAKFPQNVLYGPDLYKGMNIQHP